MQAKRRELVHRGRDGWLFLVGGNNGVLSQYRRSPWQWWHLRRWVRLIAARRHRAEMLGIRCLHTIVPEKLSIYDDRTDGLRFDPALSPARRLARRLMNRPDFVDLVGPMRGVRNEAPLFRLTDSHWTYEGCLLALRALVRACGAVPPADLAERPRFVVEKVWDLGEKLSERPSEAVSLRAIARDASRSYANGLVRSYEAVGRAADLHTGAHVVYRNPSPTADPRRVVLFGDSYAHFAPIQLTGLLAECFSELHFVWSASLDWGYLERVRPDILIVEIAERFLARLPTDDFDLSSLEGFSVPPEDPREERSDA